MVASFDFAGVVLSHLESKATARLDVLPGDPRVVVRQKKSGHIWHVGRLTDATKGCLFLDHFSYFWLLQELNIDVRFHSAGAIVFTMILRFPRS